MIDAQREDSPLHKSTTNRFQEDLLVGSCQYDENRMGYLESHLLSKKDTCIKRTLVILSVPLLYLKHWGEGDMYIDNGLLCEATQSPSDVSYYKVKDVPTIHVYA